MGQWPSVKMGDALPLWDLRNRRRTGLGGKGKGEEGGGGRNEKRFSTIKMGNNTTPFFPPATLSTTTTTTTATHLLNWNTGPSVFSSPAVM